MSSLTSHILMVRPYRFRMNDQTAINNFYQENIVDFTPEIIALKAQQEFDALVALLRSEGIRITVHQDTADPETPDALFPNNWVSFHARHQGIIYPMCAENRRVERTHDVFKTLKNDNTNIVIAKDYTAFEMEGKFLEGTGSMVLDRTHKKAYAALSERTDLALFLLFCKENDFEPIHFTAYQTVDDKRLPIYHTNVMMSVGSTFALVGLESIDSPIEREFLTAHLFDSDKTIIPLTDEQLSQFAGNMLELQGPEKSLLVMSSSAYNSLTKQQIQELEKHAKLIHSPLDTIERCGGGSARCMIAEIF